MSRRRFVLDTLGMAASQYAARAVLLARGVLAAAALGPTGFGRLNVLNLVLDYGTYAGLGSAQGLELALPGPTARGETTRARRLLAGAWGVALAGASAFALALCAAFAAGHPAVLRGLGWEPLLLVLAAVLLQHLVQVHGTALRSRGRFGVVSGSFAAQALVGGGLGLALVWSQGIVGLLRGWLVGTLVALVWVRLAAPDVPLRPGAPGEGRALVRRGVVVFAVFAVSLLLRSVDRLALIRFGTPADLGAYGLGVMAAGLVNYLPESAAAVLYPRIAAGDAVDAERTRAQVARAQAALALLLPPLVALAMLWVSPVLAWALPRFREAADAVRVLALAALLFVPGTLPGYWLLGRGRGRTLLVATAACAVVSAALVFAVAARAPRPLPVAVAACVGYLLFSICVLAIAARELRPEPGGPARLVLVSFLPAVWAGAAALLACRIGPPESWAAAALRTVAVALVCAPLLPLFGRGLGLSALRPGWARGAEDPA